MDNKPEVTNTEQLFEELDAGTFGKRLGVAISDTALGVITTGKKGKVAVTFNIKQVGESNQVNVDHTVEFVRPTHRGSQSEINTTSTALYVGARGKLTVLPNDTRDMFTKRTNEKDEA